MSEGFWYSPLLKAGSTLNSDLVARGFELDHESLQKWRLYSLSAQLISVLGWPHAGKAFSSIRFEPLVSICIHCVLPVHNPLYRACFHVLDKVLIESLLLGPSETFSRLNEPGSLSLSSQNKCSKLLIISLTLHSLAPVYQSFSSNRASNLDNVF